MTVKEAGELQECLEALASEVGRVQQQMQQRLEQQAHLFATREETTRATLHEELQSVLASLTPDRLMDSLTTQIETLVQERLSVLLSQVRQVTVSPVSDETSHLRLLSAPNVSPQRVRTASPVGTGETSHQKRIYSLLDEDRTRKPAELQRLTGIPKATVYRLVERYHREHPETSIQHETTANETMRQKTETAS